MKALCEHRNMQVMPCNYWSKSSKTCSHPLHFRCPEYIKDMGLGQDPLSHSSILNYVACRRRFYYSFFMGLRLKQKNVPLYVGSSCHEMLAMLHRGTVYPDVGEVFKHRFMPQHIYDQHELGSAVLGASALMQVYVEMGHHETKGDCEVQWLMEDPPVIGYVDMVVDKVHGYEHKVSGRPDFYTKWSLEDQLGMYFMGMPELEDITVRVLARPKLRKGKNETETEYEERCKDDIRRRPNHYFGDTVYYRHEFDLDAVFKRVKYVHDEIMRLLQSESTIVESFYQNKNVCFVPGACDYVTICQNNGIISEDLYEVRRKEVMDSGGSEAESAPAA